jgi:hypothetical protein
MSRYVLDHHLAGEKQRLSLMSQLLDPMHRRYIESLGIGRDARVLEVGCGNASMSVWMAEHIAPGGQIVAVGADYWRQTITELRGDLVGSGKLNDKLIDTFLAHCADPNWWTQTIAFTGVRARAPGA